METRSTLLGEYLMARRARVRPADVGFAPGTNRKTPGLRREEVALLAGVSTDYYLRLEQGRNRNPSPAVLDALAHALRLDHTATAHLHTLAEPISISSSAGHFTVRPSIQRLVASLNQPAYVMNRHLDVVARNPLAAAFRPSLRIGDNLVLAQFFDPLERSLPLDWDRGSYQTVGAFRNSLGNLAGDDRTVELVGELAHRSRRFRELWTSHEVFPVAGELVLPMKHPRLGEMDVELERLPIGGTDGHHLIITSAEPETESAEKLRSLASHVARM